MAIAEKKNKIIVELSKPYQFEGKEYTEIDLTGLENLTGEDLIEAEKVFSTSGQVALMSELSTGYTLIIAAIATKLPVEFFQKLPAKDAMRVKGAVMAFLNN
jgi:Phage tail assembly chaperone proteins, E, or 41 or 14